MIPLSESYEESADILIFSHPTSIMQFSPSRCLLCRIWMKVPCFPALDPMLYLLFRPHDSAIDEGNVSSRGCVTIPCAMHFPIPQSAVQIRENKPHELPTV